MEDNYRLCPLLNRYCSENCAWLVNDLDGTFACAVALLSSTVASDASGEPTLVPACWHREGARHVV